MTGSHLAGPSLIGLKSLLPCTPLFASLLASVLTVKMAERIESTHFIQQQFET